MMPLRRITRITKFMRPAAPIRAIHLFAAGYLAMAAMFVGTAAWMGFADLRDAKTAEASRLAVMMAERFDRAATAADLILRAVQTSAEDGLRRGVPLAALPWEDFRDAAAALPDPGSLWLVDHLGNLRRASTTADTPTHNFSDREYFPPHMDGTESYLSGAVRGRITGQYHWLVSRRVNGPDGAFAGVVLAAMEDSGLAAIHHGVALGPGSVLSVRRADGTLVMRHPMDDTLLGPGDAGRAEVARLLAGGDRHGWFTGPSAFGGGEEFLHAWHKTPNHDMIAIVMVPKRILWELWKPQALVNGAMFAASLVPLFFLLRLGVRSARAESAAVQSLERLNRHQHQLLRDQETVVARQRLFLDTVSHEFRTPLAIIDSTAQVLARQCPEDNTIALGKLDKIRRATHRLSDLMDTCLAEDRLGGPGDVPRLEPVDLATLAAALAREWPRVSVRGDAPVEVTGDAPLLEIALHNIVQNALKYSPPDSPVEVEVRAVEGGGEVAVTNLGGGIAPEDLPHIFDKYYRSRAPQENKPGLGLGLNIAQKIVEQHGGTITALSTPGARTTFTVTLPTGPAFTAPALADATTAH